jgi:hypothetical protein
MADKNTQSTQNIQQQNAQKKQDQVAVLRVKSRLRAGPKCAI